MSYPLFSAVIFNAEEKICHLGNATIEQMTKTLKTEEEEEKEKDVNEFIQSCELWVLNPANLTEDQRNWRPSLDREEKEEEEGDLLLDLSKEIPGDKKSKSNEEDFEEEEEDENRDDL